MKKYIKSLGVLSSMLSGSIYASSYSISSGGFSGGGFAKITELFQKWVDFMVGPYGKAIVVASIVIGVTTWAIIPNQGILGYALRGAIAGAVILNIAIWMGMLG